MTHKVGRKSAAAHTPPQSEGQRLLQGIFQRELESMRGLGDKIGCSQEIVRKWLLGTERPGTKLALELERVHGIHPAGWYCLPGERPASPDGGEPEPGHASPAAPLEQAPAQAPGPASLPVLPTASANGHTPPSVPGAVPSTLQDCLDILARLRKQRDSPSLLPGDRMKLADTEAKYLGLRAKLERDNELREDRIIREHPAWQKLKRALVKALKPIPGALAAVEAAISEQLETD